MGGEVLHLQRVLARETREIRASLSRFAHQRADIVEADVRRRIVDVHDFLDARDIERPIHVLETPAGEEVVERMFKQEGALDQKIGGRRCLRGAAGGGGRAGSRSGRRVRSGARSQAVRWA
ncbi:MAG: hypothetical protein IPL62_16675 [Caulobacteraceae bacterium]|nr:hypothetical protein [Caulobacteraceae bacterium]